MLEAFKKDQTKPAQQQANELQALIATSKEERAALSTMLTQIQLQASKLAAAGKSLQDVEELVTRANARLDQVSQRLETAESRSTELEAIDARIGTLTDGVFRAEQEAARLTAPMESCSSIGGDRTPRHESGRSPRKRSRPSRKSTRGRAHQGRRCRGRRKTRARSRNERARCSRTSNSSVPHRRRGPASSQQMQQTSADARTHAAASAEIGPGRPAPARIACPARGNGPAAEERLTALNALAEHTGQKIKILENQKHTVERAVVESNRLNEMIWNMEVQIKKLDDAARQTSATRIRVERVEKIARDVGAQLDSGVRARDEFVQRDPAPRAVARRYRDLVRLADERVEVERARAGAFDERVKCLRRRSTDSRRRCRSSRRASRTRDVHRREGRSAVARSATSAIGPMARSRAGGGRRRCSSHWPRWTSWRGHGARYEALAASRQQVDRVREEIERSTDCTRRPCPDARIDGCRSDGRSSRSSAHDDVQRRSPGAAGTDRRVAGRFASLDDSNRKADALASRVSQLEERTARA